MVSSKTGNKRRMSILTLLLEVPQLVQVGKERRWHENRKRRSITLYLFSDDMMYGFLYKNFNKSIHTEREILEIIS